MQGPIWVIYGLIGWLAILPSIGGAIGAAIYVRRSPWAIALLAGFGLETVLSLLQRFASLAIGEGIPASSVNIGLMFAIGGALGTVARLITVVGIIGVLRDLPSRREVESNAGGVGGV